MTGIPMRWIAVCMSYSMSSQDIDLRCQPMSQTPAFPDIACRVFDSSTSIGVVLVCYVNRESDCVLLARPAFGEAWSVDPS